VTRVERVEICFVCLGNICRSPTAEGVMRAMVETAGLDDRIGIESAGTGGWHVGELPDGRSRAEAKKRGYVLDSRARQFQRRDFARFEHVLAMDGDNASALVRMAPDPAARAKVRLFRSFDPTAPAGAEVPDPYYGGDDGVREVLEVCERACRGLLEHLRRQHGL
jgi:protein-tyrosine phosphatase